MEETSKKVRQREIRFRAWLIHINDWAKQEFYISMDGKKVMDHNHEECPIEDDIILCQFTGLKDKNDKDVFEDDIVHCSIQGDNVGNIDVIEFKNGSFWLRYRDRSLPSWTEFGNELEVIGNIYEHPHLLSQGEIKTELI